MFGRRKPKITCVYTDGSGIFTEKFIDVDAYKAWRNMMMLSRNFTVISAG